MLKIGVNTPLLKESIAEIGIYDTLKWVAEIGYHYIEVSQVPINPETVKEFRRAEDDFGIQVCSISVDAEPEPQTPDGARKMNVRDDLRKPAGFLAASIAARSLLERMISRPRRM